MKNWFDSLSDTGQFLVGYPLVVLSVIAVITLTFVLLNRIK